MGRHIGQMLLDFLHFGQTEASLVRLVVHLEVLDLFKLISVRPSHRLVALFLPLNRGCLNSGRNDVYLIYSCLGDIGSLAKRLSALA